MRRPKSMTRQRIEYALYRAVAAAAGRLSDDGIARWGGRLGAVARRILRKRDALAMRNLRATFPTTSEAELRRTLNDCWSHFGRQAVWYIRMQRLPIEEVIARCEVAGREILDEALQTGRGVILLTGHYGSWETGGLRLTSLVPNVLTVARPLDNQFLDRDVAAIRSRSGAQVVDRRGAARAMMRALGENGMVVLLPDQAVLAREGVRVPFLGRPAWTTTLPAKLALRLGSTIVFAFCIPHRTGHRLEFENPIRIDQLSEAESDPVALTMRINEVISRRIIARPELWLWMHDRWKGTATGESEGVNGE